MRKFLVLSAVCLSCVATSCSSGQNNGQSSNTGKHTADAPSTNADTSKNTPSAASQSTPDNKY